jgi:hypothetical protein
MGTKERNFSPLKDLSLEELVPEDNFYRRLQRTFDLSFVRELVEGRSPEDVTRSEAYRLTTLGPTKTKRTSSEIKVRTPRMGAYSMGTCTVRNPFSCRPRPRLRRPTLLSRSGTRSRLRRGFGGGLPGEDRRG